MKTPVTRLSSLVLVAAAAMAAAAAEPSARPAKAARAEDAARAARLAAWSEGLRTNANPRTRAQFRDEVFLPFWRRQTVEPFLAGPEGREPWAPEAVRLMEREIFELWNTSLVDCSGTPGIGDARDRSDIVEFVERVRTKDPFLLFLRLAAFRERMLRTPNTNGSEQGTPAAYREWRSFRNAFEKREDAPFARLLIWAGREWWYVPDDRPLATRAAVEWLRACKPSAEEVRAARFLLREIFPDREGLATQLADALDKAGPDVATWLAGSLRGEHLLRAGEWEATRSTIAENAAETEARLAGAAAKLAAARAALEGAWNVRHEAPLAAMMVRVAGLQGADDAEEWLARATNAEIDYNYAYTSYRERVCRPDKPGGAARLRAFADACRDAGHDTTGPGFHWVEAELRLSRPDGPRQRDHFADEAFARRCTEIAARVRDDPGTEPGLRPLAAKFAAVVPYLHGDLRLAAEQNKRRPPRAEIVYDDANVFALADVETVLYGLGGPHSNALLRIEEMRRAGDPAGVRREAERLLDPAVGLSPEETALAAWRADDARVELEWGSGAWIPMRFSANGVFVNGWTARRGARSVRSEVRWTAGDGWAGELSHGANTAIPLRYAVPLPEALEIRGTAEWDERRFDPWARWHMLCFGLDSERTPFDVGNVRYAEITIDPSNAGIEGGTVVSLDAADFSVRRGAATPGKFVVPDLPGKFDFRVVWKGDALSVWIGDDPTPFTARRCIAANGPRDRRLTFEGWAVRLTRLEMRNPLAPPPDPDVRPAEPDLPPLSSSASDDILDPAGILANVRTNAAMRTWSGFFRDSLGPLLRRELVAPFEAGPEAGAPWADEARAALESTVRLAWYDRMSVQFPDEWEPAVRLVLERGATDPGLRWMAAMGLAAQGRKDEAREQVRALREAVAGGRGTPFLRYLAALADWRVDGRARDEAERLGVAWAESLAGRPQDSRAVLYLLRQDLDAGRLATLLEASGSDPWLALVARGIAENTLAANAVWRRTGDEESALEYGVRYRAARDAFEAAQALHPEFPDAAREFARTWRERMDADEFLRWLRAGLAAEGDDEGLLELAKPLLQPADAPYPHQRGKDALRAFGRALVDTGRFDTQLPAFGVALLLDGAFRPREGDELWENEADYRRVCDVAASLCGADAAGWFLRDRAMGVAAACSRQRNDPDLRIDFGRRPRHSLHKEAPYYGWTGYLRPFGGLDSVRIDASGFAMAMGGPNAGDLSRIESLRRAGDWEGVWRLARSVSAKPAHPLEDKEAGFLFLAEGAAWARTRSASGDWFPVPILFHGSHEHWFFWNGGGSAPGGDEVVFRDEGDRFLEWRTEIPVDMECRGRIAFPTNAALERRAAVKLGGFAVEFRPDDGDWTVRIGLERRSKRDPEDVEARVAVATNDLPFRVSWSRGVITAFLGEAAGPVLSTEAFRDRLVGGGRPRTAALKVAGRNATVGSLAVRAPLGAAPGEEQPEGALPRFRTVLLPGGVPLELAWCPAGSFEEGFWELERQGWTGENPAPRRTAELTRGFWIARCETTRAQWRAATGGDAPGDGAPDAPVAASWDEAAAFAEKLAAVAPQEGLRWALPTETQWERAARAGREGPLDPVALGEALAPAAGAGPRPAGAARANPWGVWDLCGNAREWCADDYAPRASIDPVRDPPPARLAPGAPKAVRGGAADSAHPAELSPGFRAGRVRELRVPSIGFRVILEEDHE